jgi:hypothetical protein
MSPYVIVVILGLVFLFLLLSLAPLLVNQTEADSFDPYPQQDPKSAS